MYHSTTLLYFNIIQLCELFKTINKNRGYDQVFVVRSYGDSGIVFEDYYILTVEFWNLLGAASI